jgi:uncharacterized membrane protein
MNATRKFSAGAITGAITVIAAWVIEYFGQVQIPAPVTAAATTLVGVVVSLAIPDSLEEP